MLQSAGQLGGKCSLETCWGSVLIWLWSHLWSNYHFHLKSEMSCLEALWVGQSLHHGGYLTFDIKWWAVSEISMPTIFIVSLFKSSWLYLLAHNFFGRHFILTDLSVKRIKAKIHLTMYLDVTKGLQVKGSICNVVLQGSVSCCFWLSLSSKKSILNGNTREMVNTNIDIWSLNPSVTISNAFRTSKSGTQYESL